MARTTAENEEVIKVKMRRLMVREPRISGRRMAELLGYDRNYVCRLKKKLDREIAERVKYSTIYKDIGRLERTYETMVADLWDIINNGNAKDKDRISAFKSMFDAQNDLIDRKMDAGIFERQLGKVTTDVNLSPENEALIRQALDYAFNPERPRKNESVNPVG